MKKNFCLLAILLFAASLATAQTQDNKIFVKVYANYGFSLASSYKVSPYSSSYFDDGYTRKTNNKGLGKGPSIGIGVGYIVNDFLSIGLDLDKYSGSIETSETSSSNGGGSINNNTWTMESDMFVLTPNVTFKAIAQPKFFIYNRIGLAVGIVNKLSEKAKYEFIDNTNNQFSYTSTEHEYEGGKPLGFRSALGIQFKLSDKIRAYSEVQFSHITYSPKKKVMKGGEILDVNQTKPQPIKLEDLKTIIKDTEYVDEITTKWNDPVNNDAPSQETKFRIPFTSLSLGVGLVYKF
jgi:hypothetical protein